MPVISDRSLCVVIHDVAPSTWDACERVIAALHDVANVPLTLLAVPDYHHGGYSAAFEQRLNERHRQGDELALHGYSHLDEKPCKGLTEFLKRRVYTRGEGEFSALTEIEARQRLAAGMEWFQRNGWPVRGFVAPAWLLSDGAWRALRASGFEYTSTLRQLIPLNGGPAMQSQSLVYSVSKWWRRKLSLAWNFSLAQTLCGRRAPLIARLELHPWDADYADVRDSWQCLLDNLLRGRQARTTRAALASWHPSIVAADHLLHRGQHESAGG